MFIDRVNSFGRYTFVQDLDQYPVVKSLFTNDSFQKAAQSICPEAQQYLDPFQFNYIIEVPGKIMKILFDTFTTSFKFFCIS